MFRNNKPQTSPITGGYHPKRTSGWGMIVGAGMALVLGALFLYANGWAANVVYNNVRVFDPNRQEMIQDAVTDDGSTGQVFEVIWNELIEEGWISDDGISFYGQFYEAERN